MKYQNSPNDNLVQCTICPRNCKLKNEQSGFCHIRKNIGGNIVLTSYGFNTGLAIDPIEKKPLYHFYPGSKVLSFGTLGCNMGCQFCQNWQSSKSKEDSTLLNYTSPHHIAKIAKEHNCKSVAFTYNDPVIFFEYAVDTAKECRKRDIKTIAVTAGYINPEPAKEFFSHMDAVNIDLKAFSQKFYNKNCLANIEPILETIKYVKHKTDCWLELTTLLIEDENDSEQELKDECEWISKELGDNIPLHFSAFHPAYKFLNKNPTSSDTLLKARKIAEEAGLRYVYTGNILNQKTSTTYCHKCHSELITRVGYSSKITGIDNQGNCEHCKAKWSGIK